ncbi:hypothetical protein ACRRTK_019270 [Alexandromys fortis]
MAGLGDLLIGDLGVLISQSTTTTLLGPAGLHVTTGLKFSWMVVAMQSVVFMLLKALLS